MKRGIVCSDIRKVAVLVIGCSSLLIGLFLTSQIKEQVFPRMRHDKHPQPNIVIILADDMGWNDVGYHGSFIRTPTIDKLAAEGVKLEKFYANEVCTPSRASLLSGRYPIHLGLQHLHIDFNQARGLPLSCTLLPEALRSYGYRNYMVGKWHLGFYKEDYTPYKRGFDRFYGIFPGQADHYDFHLKADRYTLIEDGKPAFQNDSYDTFLYVNKAKQYIDTHLQEQPDKPMFLYTAFQQVHAPLQVPAQYTAQYAKLKQHDRRKNLAGMATCMDEGIKNLTQHLKDRGMWNNTILFFISDNGGHDILGSSNLPLNGGKNTLLEGGIRTIAFLTGKGVKPGCVSHRLYHITDIYPTLLGLARRHWPGLDEEENRTQLENRTELENKVHDYLPLLDGHDVWDSMTQDLPSPRREVLVNIDPAQQRFGDSMYPELYDSGVRSGLIAGKWKILTGWHQYPFHQRYFDVKKCFDTTLNKTKNVWLYNIKLDPEEKHDLFHEHPKVVELMLQKLRQYNTTVVPPQHPAVMRDWQSKKYPNHVYPWM